LQGLTPRKFWEHPDAAAVGAVLQELVHARGAQQTGTGGGCGAESQTAPSGAAQLLRPPHHQRAERGLEQSDPSVESGGVRLPQLRVIPRQNFLLSREPRSKATLIAVEPITY